MFRFVIDPQNSSQEDLVESAEHADLVKVEEKIEEGKEETSER
ncbi:hypothetical protein [Leadbetterella byssophila]|nr:hypothetical protein [Leadbetterella byssophila]